MRTEVASKLDANFTSRKQKAQGKPPGVAIIAVSNLFWLESSLGLFHFKCP